MDTTEETTYEITLPGRLYRSLNLLGIFEEEGSPTERRAKDLIDGARRLPAGRGTRHAVGGSHADVRYILRRLKELEDEAHSGTVRFEELGVSTVELSKVVRQTPAHVNVPRETPTPGGQRD